MDGTEERKDTSQSGDTSGEQKGTSKDTKTYTKDSEEKAVSDALSAAGRDAKSISNKAAEAERILTNAKKLSDATKAEREQAQKDRDEAEQEAVKDDPAALKSLQREQAQKNETAKLAKERAELDVATAKHQETVTADKEQIRVFKRTQLAAEVAVAKGVTVDSILKLTQEDTREAMEATAAILLEKKPLKTDDGTTLGSSGSWEEARAAFIKNPSNPAVYKRYKEMLDARNAEK